MFHTTLLARCGALALFSVGGSSATIADTVVSADFSHPIYGVPDDFLGISVETDRIDGVTLSSVTPSFPYWLRQLGPHGVLRVGGRTSDETRPSPANLALFAQMLHSTGWGLIYGLNFKTGSPAAAAQDASLLYQLCGDRVRYFQVGNEPDLIPNYGVAPFVTAFNSFTTAVRAAVPGARFAGPDVSSDTSWLGRFAAGTRPFTGLLTRHYYAQGATGNAWNNLLHLLGSIGDLEYRASLIRAQDAQAQLPVRITEMNSAHGGGQVGVSDVYGSVLWAIVAMHSLAADGVTGVNIHSNDPSPYSPLLRDAAGVFHPQPIYWALKFVASNAQGSVVPVTLMNTAPGFYAFAILSPDGWRRLILANLSVSSPVTVRVPIFDGLKTFGYILSGTAVNQKSMWINGTEVTEDMRAWHTSPIVNQAALCSATLNSASIQVLQTR